MENTIGNQNKNSKNSDAMGVDRKKLGLGQLFSELHPILSPSNEMSPEETVELLCLQTRRTRRRFAARVNEGIAYITDDKTIDVSDYINDDIRELAKYPVGSDGLTRLTPFVKWLQALHRENSLAIDRSRYAVSDAASHMDRATGDFLRAGFEHLMWHGVLLEREGDTVRLCLRERLWGKAQLVFPNVRTKFEGTFPLAGIFFWMDAARADGGFSFTFLLDVEFGSENLERRAMQDRNWVRLSFDCDCPRMEYEGFDYGRYLDDFGFRGHGFIERWCGEVISKESVLGAASLSRKEKELLPLAKILLMAYQLADIAENGEADVPTDGSLSQKVLETLDNRYGLTQWKPLFTDNGQPELFELLEKTVEAWGASDDFEETNKLVWMFAGMLRRKEEEDGVRALYRALTARMRECAAEFGDRSRIYGTYQEAQNVMKELLEPKLRQAGFGGEYPHYRRRRGRRGEYISVNTYDMNNRTVNGVMMYDFSLAAATVRLDRKGRGRKAEYFAGGLPFDESTAADCARANTRGVKYAELGGEGYEPRAQIGVVVFDGAEEDGRPPDTPEELARCLDVALRGMKNKKMPRWYKKANRAALRAQKHRLTMNELIGHYLPVGIYAAALLMGGYIVCGRFFTVTDYVPQLTGSAAVVLSLLAGAFLTVVCAAVRMCRLRKRIWRY